MCKRNCSDDVTLDDNMAIKMQSQHLGTITIKHCFNAINYRSHYYYFICKWFTLRQTQTVLFSVECHNNPTASFSYILNELRKPIYTCRLWSKYRWFIKDAEWGGTCTHPPPTRTHFVSLTVVRKKLFLSFPSRTQNTGLRFGRCSRSLGRVASTKLIKPIIKIYIDKSVARYRNVTNISPKGIR